VAVSVRDVMRGYSLRGCIDEQKCRKATDDCNLRFDVGPAVEVLTSCLLKIPSLPTDTVLSQTSSPLSLVMSQLVWDNIFGTISQGICCQGLGPMHGTDKADFTSHSLKYHAGCQPSGTLRKER
jgi:hypothetical protein